jgi:DNA polymerase-1
MEDNKQFARTHGFVETRFGRRIHIREIYSKVPGVRAGAERAAINAPIQGTAADVIRRAMARLPGALADAKLNSTIMLLQVHDELIFETPEKDAAKSCKLIAQVMEKATLPAVEISVPLLVEARAADNSDAAH